MIAESITARITLRHCSSPLTQSTQGHPVCRTTAALRGFQHPCDWAVQHLPLHHTIALYREVKLDTQEQLMLACPCPAKAGGGLAFRNQLGTRQVIYFYGASTALCSSARQLGPAHHLFTEPKHLRTGFGKQEGLCKLMGFTKWCFCLVSNHISFTGQGAHTPFFLHHFIIHRNPFIVINQY